MNKLLLLALVFQSATVGQHQAIINWSNASCTTNAPCNIQVYRTKCASVTTCPTYPSGVWKPMDMTLNLVPNIGASGTSWIFTDKDPALQNSTVYSWVATNSFINGSQSSSVSDPFIGTTNNGVPTLPHLSTNGNSVN